MERFEDIIYNETDKTIVYEFNFDLFAQLKDTFISGIAEIIAQYARKKYIRHIKYDFSRVDALRSINSYADIDPDEYEAYNGYPLYSDAIDYLSLMKRASTYGGYEPFNY